MSSPTRFVPPWAQDFSNDANDAWAVVGDVVSDVTGGTVVLPPDPIPPSVITPAPPVPPTSVTVTPAPSPGVPTTIPQGSVTDISAALKTLLPTLEADFANYAQQYLADILSGKVPSPVPNVTYDGQNITQMAAKGHAWRTFLIGLGTTSVTAVLSAISQNANVDYFSKEGWVATGALAVGTLVNTVISYIGRLQVTPNFEQKLLAAPAGTVEKR